MALAIAGFPTEKMSVQQIQEILGGGVKACEDAGIPIAGGHTIDAPEPIYGLAAVGLVSVNNIKRNDGAKAGDKIILGKGLGVGILGAALNKGKLDEIGYSELITSTTKLNSIGYGCGVTGSIGKEYTIRVKTHQFTLRYICREYGYIAPVIFQ